MTNRIRVCCNKPGGVLSLYLTAGFPRLHDTVTLCELAQEAGVDMLEIGMPFSDPIADGATIQASSQQAISNGMTIEKLFYDLANVRERVSVPLILMGYLNPVLQFGMTNFLECAASVGIDGVILPDLPIEEYENSYREAFMQHGITPIFLITARTPKDRILAFDRASDGFLYLVSSDGVTGGYLAPLGPPIRDFKAQLSSLELNNPIMVGFGITDRISYEMALSVGKGAIIGSAFIRSIAMAAVSAQDPTRSDRNLLSDMVLGFVGSIREPHGFKSLRSQEQVV